MDIIAVDSVSLCLNTEKPTLMYSCDIFLLAVEMKPITIQQSRLTTTSWWVHKHCDRASIKSQARNDLKISGNLGSSSLQMKWEENKWSHSISVFFRPKRLTPPRNPNSDAVSTFLYFFYSTTCSCQMIRVVAVTRLLDVRGTVDVSSQRRLDLTFDFFMTVFSGLWNYCDGD